MNYCNKCGQDFWEWCACPPTFIAHTERRVPAESGSVQRVDGWLTVPTEPAPCYIPLGMSEEDVQLLEASIKLWRDRLIRSTEKEPPIVGTDVETERVKTKTED